MLEAEVYDDSAYIFSDDLSRGQKQELFKCFMSAVSPHTHITFCSKHGSSTISLVVYFISFQKTNCQSYWTTVDDPR